VRSSAILPIHSKRNVYVTGSDALRTIEYNYHRCAIYHALVSMPRIIYIYIYIYIYTFALSGGYFDGSALPICPAQRKRFLFWCAHYLGYPSTRRLISAEPRDSISSEARYGAFTVTARSRASVARKSARFQTLL